MTAPSFQSRVLGCFLGGAVGDALGAPVEFISLDEIRDHFGADGVTGFVEAKGRGAITDDTQMTLFTAEGLIRAKARYRDRGICDPSSVVHRAYLRWLWTQNVSAAGNDDPLTGSVSKAGWLVTNVLLHRCRAPGNTCLSALKGGEMGTIEEPLNDSKGCGGVMRVAPVGLMAQDPDFDENPFNLGAEVAALTHGHPSGFLAAGAFALMISCIARGESLPNAVDTAMGELEGHEGHEETHDALQHAVDAATKSPSAEQLTILGEGWVAEEALAISVYCALTAKDFLSGVLLAVNHDGDSDSTGAITGNLLGTLHGAEAIPLRLSEGLEGRETIEQLANDFLAVIEDPQSLDGRRYPPN